MRAVRCTGKFGAPRFIPVVSVHRSGFRFKIYLICINKNGRQEDAQKCGNNFNSYHAVDGKEDKSRTVCTLCTSQFFLYLYISYFKKISHYIILPSSSLYFSNYLLENKQLLLLVKYSCSVL